jgi:hypothetical protein
VAVSELTNALTNPRLLRLQQAFNAK